MVNPSGYCGANKSIRQAGKKKTAINAPEAKATNILDGILSLLVMVMDCLKTSGTFRPGRKCTMKMGYQVLIISMVVVVLHLSHELFRCWLESMQQWQRRH